ncbi:unnamed protein product [Onchocerca flexuosa]|uniref:Alpha-carbonic anhydrase domain-containing protein n=1 Tax=Onchocerca flexuosa TaxID=387005 RepID=A0A183I8L8_9BILA|nr:unnamed protein product [Onchocerca flexuosa]
MVNTTGNFDVHLSNYIEFLEENSSKSISSAPVPGIWSGPDYHEMNISHNKQLQRDEVCSNTLGVITKKYTFCAIPEVTVCAAAPKLSKPVEIALSSAFRPVIVNKEKVSLSMKYPR